MSEDTKVCPYCAETIKAEAIVCRYCGRDLKPKPIEQPAIAQPAQKQEVMTQEDKKNPAIGFIGLIAVVLGLIFCAVSESQTFGAIVVIVGAAVLGYALVTGNIKLFG